MMVVVMVWCVSTIAVAVIVTVSVVTMSAAVVVAVVISSSTCSSSGIVPPSVGTAATTMGVPARYHEFPHLERVLLWKYEFSLPIDRGRGLQRHWKSWTREDGERSRQMTPPFLTPDVAVAVAVEEKVSNRFELVPNS